MHIAACTVLKYIYFKERTDNANCQGFTASERKLLGRALNDGNASSSHIRINVIGNQGVGKTSLVQRLNGDAPSVHKVMSSANSKLSEHTICCVCGKERNVVRWEGNVKGMRILLVNFLKIRHCVIRI